MLEVGRLRLAQPLIPRVNTASELLLVCNLQQQLG